MLPVILAIAIAAGGHVLPAGGRVVNTPDLHIGVRPHVEASPDRIDSIGVTVQVSVLGL
jgi:hypothetical protein